MAITRIGPNQSINLASNITGTLPVANGGTAITSGFINGTATPGKVLQVQSTSMTDSTSTSSGSFVDISGLSVNITPSATSSKILIICQIQSSNNTLDRVMGFQLVRGSTAIAIGDSDGGNRVEATMSGSMVGSDSTNEQKNFSFNHLDSPNSSSQQTYKMQGKAQGTGDVLMINKSGSDSNHDYQFRTISTITAMEIAG